ncbi:MAG: cysteine desulfurase [Lachnospiraceae bacterium]|nr:cysteine desulfurase [Lachnospiraceae bacterium]
MEAYLDNSATTMVFDSVKDIMVRTMTTDFGNPSSLHTKGMEAERYVKTAREAVARQLKAEEKEIVFTSGGTEANNMALIGAALANRRRGNHVITTGIEHASVLSPVRFLEEQGFRVTYLPVDERGVVRMDALEEALDEETILVSVMYVNNEIGSVQPVAEIARRVHEKNPEILFHVDAIQAFGKYVIRPKREGIDLLSVSGHKIHGPKGSGFLYIRDRAKVRPLILGGGQQKGMRSGTENVPGIAGLGEAVTEIYRNHEERTEALYRRKERFAEGLSRMEDVRINGPRGREGAPHIVSASFAGIRAEVMLHALEDAGVYVSSGSACSSQHNKSYSATLTGIGLAKELLDCTVRFSFSIFTTEEEIDYALEVLGRLVPALRKYRRN